MDGIETGRVLFALAQTGPAPVIPATVAPAGDIQAVAARAIASKISDTSIRTVGADTTLASM